MLLIDKLRARGPFDIVILIFILLQTPNTFRIDQVLQLTFHLEQDILEIELFSHSVDLEE